MVVQANAADQVIVPSQHFADKLLRVGVETPTSVISNGLEEPVLRQIGAPTVRTKSPGEPLRVMWCGRVSPEKRPEVFLDALGQLSSTIPGGFAANMYGDGIALGRTRRAAASLGEPVTLHGSVSQTEVLQAMREHHVIVSSSLDFDNQPMVLIEAIASGLPIVYCDPDLSEMVPAGGGVLTKTPDAAGIAGALAELAAEPSRIRELSAALGASGGATSQRSHLAELVAVYEAAAS